MPFKPLNLTAPNGMGGFKPLDFSGAKQSLGMSNESRMQGFQVQQQKQDQQKTLGDLPTGDPAEVGGVVANTLNPINLLTQAGRFVKSAFRAPVDIVRGAMGLDPYMTDQEKNDPSQQTYQGQFASETVPKVMSGDETPASATVGTVADVLGGAGAVLGAGEFSGIGKVPAALESVTEGNVIGKGTAQEISDAVSARSTNKATDVLNANEETMTKAEREQAIDERRLITTKTGRKIYVPSDTETRAGQILKGKVTGDPIKDVNIVKDEISSRGAEAEQYLRNNAKAITNKEDFDAFNSVRTKSGKYMTKTELSAYDEQVRTFQNILKDEVKGKGYTTDAYYRALKDFEDNVADRLPKGKQAILDPTGVSSAKVRAASDVRTVVRDMIGSKNPEFKGKMFDLASLYDVKSNVITKADQLPANRMLRFAKQHKLISAGIGAATAGALGAGGTKIVQAATSGNNQ